MTTQQNQTNGASRWPDIYPWAYIDAAKKQLSALSHGMREGIIRPSARDAARLNASLDDLAVQAVVLRQMVADITALDEQDQRRYAG
jgi:hypothetical protein